MNTPPIVSAQEWAAAHQQLLAKEKEVTRARDALAAQRRRMPWLAVEKYYQFEGPEGMVNLLGLFQGRRQLVVYRAFFEPGVHGWPDHACPGCSMIADHIGNLAHLNARDTTLVFASPSPQAEWHGTNAFIHNGDRVFRTYFINNRGDEALGTTWSFLDMTALGRQEVWEDSPEGYPQSAPYEWWSWHDEYGEHEPSRWFGEPDPNDPNDQRPGR
jgi:predicted dithiol-disulfide oxidoreductase (DUF899 family)